MQQCFPNNWVKLDKRNICCWGRFLTWGIWFIVEMRSFQISYFLSDRNFSSSSLTAIVISGVWPHKRLWVTAHCNLWSLSPCPQTKKLLWPVPMVLTHSLSWFVPGCISVWHSQGTQIIVEWIKHVRNWAQTILDLKKKYIVKNAVFSSDHNQLIGSSTIQERILSGWIYQEKSPTGQMRSISLGPHGREPAQRLMEFS